MNLLFLIGTPLLLLAIGGLIVLGHNWTIGKTDKQIAALEAKIRADRGKPDYAKM